MANECKMEFYFKKEEIEKLLAANPKAKGIIISHEIVREKPRGSLNYLNIVRIKARVDPAAKKVKAKTTKAAMAAFDGPDDPIDPVGCPFPPGCTGN
jgi:hypothetical protein